MKEVPLAAWVSIALAISCAECSTPTKMTDVWRDPNYSRGPLRNVVVFGGNVSEANRRSLEHGFASGLSEHRVRATPSYELFPGEIPNKEAARAALQWAGVDGALVSTLRGLTENASYVEGGLGFWDGYYGHGWGSGDSPGDAVTEPVVKFETSVWDVRDPVGKVIWTASTQTDNPSSGKDFVSSLRSEVVPALVKAGVLPPAPSGKEVSFVPRSAVP